MKAWNRLLILGVFFSFVSGCGSASSQSASRFGEDLPQEPDIIESSESDFQAKDGVLGSALGEEPVVIVNSNY